MSTHATIFTLVDGEYIGMYVQFDGYIDGLGKTLAEHYQSYDDAIALIKNGDASYISETIEKSKFYSERGEKIELYISYSLDGFIGHYGEEFNYFFNPEKQLWECHQI